jgi:hypothetical protein
MVPSHFEREYFLMKKKLIKNDKLSSSYNILGEV